MCSGPRPGEWSDEPPIDYIAECEGDAEAVLARAREVLATVLEASSRPSWPSLEEWKTLLPEWFVAVSARERSRSEIEADNAWYRTLSHEEQVRVYLEESWSVGEFLRTFSPDGGDRWWHWWDGVVEDRDTIRVTIQALDFPTAWDELHWLLRAAGAKSMYEAPWGED